MADTPNVATLLTRRKQLAEALSDEYALKWLDTDRAHVMTREATVDAGKLDAQKLCVPCTITTQDEDRERDVIITAGIDTSMHRLNPTVLLNHGWGTGEKFPTVARSEDRDTGAYTVELSAGRGRSVSWFSQSIKDSEDTFRLIEEGLLNGVSIGIRILQADYRKDHPDDYRGWPGLMVARSELFEYSHCPIGVNPYALADRISKGYGGKAFSEGVRKSFDGYLPALKIMATGGYEPAVVPAATAMAPAPAAPPAPPAPDTTKAIEPPATPATPMPTPAATPPAAPETPPPETAKADNTHQPEAPPHMATEPTVQNPAAATPPTPAPVTTPPATAAAKATDTLPPPTPEPTPASAMLPGALALSTCYGLGIDLAEAVTDCFRSQENAAVTAALDEGADLIERACDLWASAFAAEYPEVDGLTLAVEGEGAEGTDPNPTEKALLRLTPVAKALASRVKATRQKAAAETLRKKLSKSATATCKKAADYCSEIAEHDGPLKESHKAAAMHHCSALKALTADGGDGDEGEEAKALKAENAQLREKLAKALDLNEQIQREIRKARRVR